MLSWNLCHLPKAYALNYFNTHIQLTAPPEPWWCSVLCVFFFLSSILVLRWGPVAELGMAAKGEAHGASAPRACVTKNGVQKKDPTWTEIFLVTSN